MALKHTYPGPSVSKHTQNQNHHQPNKQNHPRQEARTVCASEIYYHITASTRGMFVCVCVCSQGVLPPSRQHTNAQSRITSPPQIVRTKIQYYTSGVSYQVVQFRNAVFTRNVFKYNIIHGSKRQYLTLKSKYITNYCPTSCLGVCSYQLMHPVHSSIILYYESFLIIKLYAPTQGAKLCVYGVSTTGTLNVCTCVCGHTIHM